MRGRWELTDEQWEMIEPVLRPARRADGRGRPWHDTRAVLNGVLWVLGTGAQWRELPDKYPPFQTCHRRFEKTLELFQRFLHREVCPLANDSVRWGHCFPGGCSCKSE